MISLLLDFSGSRTNKDEVGHTGSKHGGERGEHREPISRANDSGQT